MPETDYDTFETDVLVIGAGGAGLRAAVAASSKGAKTLLVCKSLLGKAHTVMAEGGVAAAVGNVDPLDNWQVHFADTMKGGQMINQWKMVELFAKEAPERVIELEQWGAVFDRTPEGRINQRPFGAHTFRRLCHVGDRTGLEIIRTLQDRGVHQGIDVHMEVTLTRLITHESRVVGAFGYYRETGKFVLYRAKAVILATGGWGKIYKVTSNSWESTGDGIGMALEAGAELIDMEMVQFHPTGMIWPPGVKGILVTEAVRGEGGLLTNSQGERFMLTYDPAKKELSSRDVVARSIYKEVQAGRGTPHGGAWLDITHRGADYIKRKLPSMYEQFLKLADIDITTTKMEVGPTIHYAMGGVRTDPPTGATTVAGLYAAGEVAGGLHGANRLGGNSLSDLLVFGKRAGEAAAEFALKQTLAPVSGEQVDAERRVLLEPLERKEGGENPYLLMEELQDIMQEGAGISKTEGGLLNALARLRGLQARAKKMAVPGTRHYNPGWHTARDVRFMLLIAECIIRCAIERKESRGAQWRTDFPNPDPEWGKKNLICKAKAGAIDVSTRPLEPMPAELSALISKEWKK
jgi:succinate dehydrogenase / fumarate reductase, flavoprotein subunit